eukprot:8615153-Pyramimonas_sp.AAC.2
MSASALNSAFHGQYQIMPVEVRRCEDPARGNGVFALRQITRGEVSANPLLNEIQCAASLIPGIIKPS